MKIALASAPVKNRDIAFNVQRMIDVIDGCRGKADMVVFGESVLQGFECLCWDYETDLNMAAAQNDPRIAQIRDAAERNQIAVSFGYIEKVNDALFSSQLVIDDTGAVIHNFHRVSVGWKEYWQTDEHYCEGKSFEAFCYGGKKFAVGLCGDLWTDGRPEEMKALNADIVLWPVWCDYGAEEWNNNTKYEYARQAALCGRDVFLVNPFCVDPSAEDCATGGGVHFRGGRIVSERPAGLPGILIAEL